MRLLPITISAAKVHVSNIHRHHRPPAGGLFALAAEHLGEVVGVVIVGRPVARMNNDGHTCEVTRCATDGTRNACSFLYGASWRAARAIGYRRMLTYTLPEEGGASLRATGWLEVGDAGGGPWSRPSRPREDHHPLSIKTKWVVTTVDYELVSGVAVSTRGATADEPQQINLFGEA